MQALANFCLFFFCPAGLPDDQFSKENAVLVTKSNRFPLMIDPQQQATNWIKKMEHLNKNSKEEDKSILDPQTDGLINKLELAISWGLVVLIQNLDEEVDPALEPILNKSLKAVAGRLMLCIGADHEIKYDPNFRLYMSTKLPNPKYKAEISTKVTLINFTVKEEGLEEQLISVVINKMEPQLETSKTDLVRKKSNNDQKLKELDDKILKMLQESKGSLIDDLDLIKALQAAKDTEEEIRHQMETSATQMRKTLAARNSYVSLAKLAAKLYFVINDFCLIDHMYQFSLQQYTDLFEKVIVTYQGKAQAVNDNLQDKLNNISVICKEEVYKYACRGLFEQDKLLLSLQMAVKLSEVDHDEWNFFLRGADPTIDRKQQPPVASDWISHQSWDAICDLDKMANFTGIVGAFTHNNKEYARSTAPTFAADLRRRPSPPTFTASLCTSRRANIRWGGGLRISLTRGDSEPAANRWSRWYKQSTPESDSLPGEWETKCDSLRKMIMVKTIRPDRVLFSATLFVQEKLGDKFITPPAFRLDDLINASSPYIPILFILSPGTDPFALLDSYAKQHGNECPRHFAPARQRFFVPAPITSTSYYQHFLLPAPIASTASSPPRALFRSGFQQRARV